MVRYTGKVASVRRSEGFGFIGIKTLAREDGNPHGLKTVSDIFIHEDDCRATLEVGLTLKFEVIPDQRRGDGYFRAQGAEEHILTCELLPATGDVMPGLNLAVRRPPIPYHMAMKNVPEGEVAQARINAPLHDLPRDEASIQLPDDEAGIHRALGGYLEKQFPQLAGIQMSYEIVGYDASTQDTLVAAEVAGLREITMNTQAQELEETYARFKAVRRLLVLTLEQGLLRPGTKLSPSILKALFSVLQQAETSDNKQAMVIGAEKTLGFMIEKGILRPNTIVPNELIVELTVACPNWYWMLGQEENSIALARSNLTTGKDPTVNRVTQKICEMVPTQQWADFFQLFNRRTRGLDRYQGEIIPTHIRALLKPARAVFDDIAIITPYHDVAGADWEDIDWLRSIDPYVIGFKWDLPVFFVLGRYSDSGIFPLIEELVADTVQFLRTNKVKLKGFNHTDRPFWYVQGLNNELGNQCMPCANQPGAYLTRHVNQLLQAFEAGILFDWLRGTAELPGTDIARK